jgi:hypothetical protein
VRSVTPRANVVQHLAVCEAELLNQRPRSGHVMVALIWEAGGIAAKGLADAGLPKGSEATVRGRLAAASLDACGMDAHSLLSRAGVVAGDLGHGWIVTEQQLLALTADASLSADVLPSEIATRAAQRAREILAEAERRRSE